MDLALVDEVREELLQVPLPRDEHEDRRGALAGVVVDDDVEIVDLLRRTPGPTSRRATAGTRRSSARCRRSPAPWRARAMRFRPSLQRGSIPASAGRGPCTRATLRAKRSRACGEPLAMRLEVLAAADDVSASSRFQTMSPYSFASRRTSSKMAVDVQELERRLAAPLQRRVEALVDRAIEAPCSCLGRRACECARRAGRPSRARPHDRRHRAPCSAVRRGAR